MRRDAEKIMYRLSLSAALRVSAVGFVFSIAASPRQVSVPPWFVPFAPLKSSLSLQLTDSQPFFQSRYGLVETPFRIGSNQPYLGVITIARPAVSDSVSAPSLISAVPVSVTLSTVRLARRAVSTRVQSAGGFHVLLA